MPTACVIGPIFSSANFSKSSWVSHTSVTLIPSAVFVTQWNNASGSAGASGLETHPLDDLVVLLERHAR